VTEDDARGLVERVAGRLPADQDWVVRKVPAGWALHQQSREYLETGEFSAQVVGQRTWLVRESGEVDHFGSDPESQHKFQVEAGLLSE